jgi:hypothetical protein
MHIKLWVQYAEQHRGHTPTYGSRCITDGSCSGVNHFEYPVESPQQSLARV